MSPAIAACRGGGGGNCPTVTWALVQQSITSMNITATNQGLHGATVLVPCYIGGGGGGGYISVPDTHRVFVSQDWVVGTLYGALHDMKRQSS